MTESLPGVGGSVPEASVIHPAINTSPLIFLTKGNCLHLLQAVSPKIIVPQAVATEIQAYGAIDVTAQALVATPWLIIKETFSVPSIVENWDLGAGESAVLTWGYANPGAEVIVDDLAARRCASALGIPVRGTLGIVLNAKRKGVIPAARPVLEQLRLCGMYLSDRVMNQALALIGE